MEMSLCILGRGAHGPVCPEQRTLGSAGQSQAGEGSTCQGRHPGLLLRAEGSHWRVLRKKMIRTGNIFKIEHHAKGRGREETAFYVSRILVSLRKAPDGDLLCGFACHYIFLQLISKISVSQSQRAGCGLSTRWPLSLPPMARPHWHCSLVHSE